MHGKAPRKNTVYAEYVNANVPKLLGQGKAAYTIEELAQALGLKPTHNFKRRVWDLAVRQVIAAAPAFTEKGQMITVYHLPEVVQQQEYPF